MPSLRDIVPANLAGESVTIRGTAIDIQPLSLAAVIKLERTQPEVMRLLGTGDIGRAIEIGGDQFVARLIAAATGDDLDDVYAARLTAAEQGAIIAALFRATSPEAKAALEAAADEAQADLPLEPVREVG